MRPIRICRTFVIAATVTAALLATAARGEDSKTAHEGLMKAQVEGVKAQASYLQAQADMVGAISEAVKKRAETRKILEETRTLALDNDLKSAEVFYEKRAAREEYQANHARPRPRPEDLDRYSKASVPDRLSQVSFVSTRKAIRWPAVFEREEFAPLRAKLDACFARRSFGDYGVGSSFYREVHEMTDKMRAELLCLIQEIPPMEYVAAKKFIESVGYEAQCPQVLDSVASR